MSQLLFSLSVVYMVYSASIASSEKTRAKRSLLLDNVLHHRLRWQKQHKANEKRSAFDTLDLDMLLNDPVFQEAGKDEHSDTFDYNDLDFGNLPDYSDLPPLEKDEMSNVIPGAQGPFDFEPIPSDHVPQHTFKHNNFPAYPEFSSAHRVAESLMDEFMQFLTLKETGMLDQCLGTRKRK